MKPIDPQMVEAAAIAIDGIAFPSSSFIPSEDSGLDWARIMAVIAAQPRPEMAEIMEAVGNYGAAACAVGVDGFTNRTEKLITERYTAVEALIERTLAVPAGHVVVPVAEIERHVHEWDSAWEGTHQKVVIAEQIVNELRALLPEETGDE